jgi:hypothetical protein
MVSVALGQLLQGLGSDGAQLTVGQILGHARGHQGVHRPQEKVMSPGGIKKKYAHPAGANPTTVSYKATAVKKLELLSLFGHFKCVKQDCQMTHFQTKNPNLGKFCRVLQWKTVGIFYWYLVYFTAI